jgi:hypothetical protein
LIEVRMRSDLKIRAEIADLLPFFLRAWWLRDRIENEDINFGQQSTSSLPLFALYSDPMCDAANVDNFML